LVKPCVFKRSSTFYSRTLLPMITNSMEFQIGTGDKFSIH